MRISFNWLKELCVLPAGTTADEVARRLTLAGLEVESIERRGREVSGVRVVEVRGARPHPGAEKLRIVRVSTGTGVEEEVVCGAPNVPAPGGRVAWAPPGATLPGGLKLGRKEIRGFESPGMICSEKELGIGEGVDGILILSTDVPVGIDLASVLGIADDVFEVNVTPNRADALSHAGIAREVAALFGVPWKLPTPEAALVDASAQPASVDVRDPEACPRYQATVIRGVSVGVSPLWMRMRLSSCGVRSISNLVDVSNYVMLETGHPLHAFDADKLDGGVIVRRAAPGEVMRTLDGIDRSLVPGDIVIADARGAVALAGVMGGAATEITNATTNLLLESATFDPRSVRRTAKRLGLHSEASHRFERGVDAAGIPGAGARAASLMARLGGGRIAGAPVDRYPAVVEPRHVKLRVAALRRVAGFEIPTSQAIEKLRAVEIAVTASGDDLLATVPTFRSDITIEEDLIEEVMRLVGYDQVPSRLPGGGRAPEPSPDRLADRARDALTALGLHEIVGWAFVPRVSLAALGDAKLEEGIVVKNPISADYEVMRTSLLPGLAEAARRNLSRGVSDVRIFEVGPVIRPVAGDDHHHQSNVAAGLLVGRQSGWLKPGEPIDFFDLKRIVVELLAALAVRETVFIQPAQAPAFLHPGVAAEVRESTDSSATHPLGLAGELHPRVAARLGIEVPAFYFELRLDPLEQRTASVLALAPPRFPAVTRDVSFWIDSVIAAEAQRAAMRASGEALLSELSVLEDFRDPRFVSTGKKGMLWTMTYRADDRTLTDAEVDGAHARVVATLGRLLPIQIR